MEKRSGAANPKVTANMLRHHASVISRVTDNGLGYLVDQATREVLPFTFDKIPRYRGESVSEMGLKADSVVQYDVGGDGTVASVIISEPRAKGKKRALFSW